MTLTELRKIPKLFGVKQVAGTQTSFIDKKDGASVEIIKTVAFIGVPVAIEEVRVHVTKSNEYTTQKTNYSGMDILSVNCKKQRHG